MFSFGRRKVSSSSVEERLDELEKWKRQVEQLSGESRSGRVVDAEKVDQAIRDLAVKVKGVNPQTSYVNERFRTYEWAVLNIKQLGYQLARQLAESNLARKVSSAPSTRLRSSLCTQNDIESDWFLFWSAEMMAAPIYHRKLWELCYICQVLASSGKLAHGMRGLGFGCGQESLPSVFVKYGASILATDLDPLRAEAKDWQSSGQHSASAEALRMRNICTDEEKLKQISFRSVDMNAIPHEFDGQFDFCWSACALEHLGSIEKGLQFIEKSLRTLKPGGVAVHTTELNLQDGETIDNWPTVLFQKRHLVEFADKLERQGFTVEPFDFNPGAKVLDGFVDIPPWGSDAIRISDATAHLKLCVDGYPCTSVGMIIRR